MAELEQTQNAVSLAVLTAIHQHMQYKEADLCDSGMYEQDVQAESPM